jgi:hypothetical protein
VRGELSCRNGYAGTEQDMVDLRHSFKLLAQAHLLAQGLSPSFSERELILKGP